MALGAPMPESEGRFALLVSIKVKAGQVERFEQAMLANAEAAVRDEAGCHMFHVTQVEDDPQRFVLYEVYTDAAALTVHHSTPHFLRFHEEAGDTIEDKSVQRLRIHG